MMETHACADCGAQNRVGSDFCWQCYSVLRETEPAHAAAAPPSWAPVEAGPLARLGSARPVQQAPPPPNAVPPAPIPPPPPPPPAALPPAYRVLTPAGTPPSSVQKRFAVGIGIVAALLGTVGGWWAVDQLLGAEYEFPEAIGGIELTDTGDASKLPLIAGTGLEGEVGVYGPPATPDYALLVLTLPAGDIDRWWELTTDHWDIEDGAGKAGAMRFFCQDNPVVDSGSTCLWVAGDLLVELDGFFVSTSGLRPTALELYALGPELAR